MPGTLHITNGEAVQLRQTGLAGEVLIWGDTLHEGPVPATLDLDELRPVRASFLAGLSGQPEHEILGALESRDRTLARFAEFEEVVLWFEHDLYDQLQLIQILDWFAGQQLGRTKLTLICEDRYLGPLRPDELLSMYPGRRPVTSAQLQLAAEAWRALCAAEPNSLARLVREDTSALPYLQGALLRHLEQFPSTRNGLSRTERQILEIAGAELLLVGSIFSASQEREERIFMGDLAFIAHLNRLVNARVPLLRVVKPESALWKSEVENTPEGRAVLRGEADHLRLNGIDRWLGGVHLQGEHVWRWDGENGNLAFASSPPLG